MAGGVWDLDLEPTRKFVLLAILALSPRGAATVAPSVAQLARHTGHSVRSVQRALADLVDGGLLAVDCLGGGRGHPTTYRFHLEKGARLSPFPRRRPVQAPRGRQGGTVST